MAKVNCNCCQGTGRVTQHYVDKWPEPWGDTITHKENAECANCRGRGFVYRNQEERRNSND